MEDGIIINGVKYDAAEAQTLNGCKGCVFDTGQGCRAHSPCFAFHPLDVIFVKSKDKKK